MEEFSKRYGFQLDKSFQVQSMDDDLRNGLWNALHIYFWSKTKRSNFGRQPTDQLNEIINYLWINILKSPLSDISWEWNRIESRIMAYFNSIEWYQVYNFIEFMAPLANKIQEGNTQKFIEFCNNILETEKSAYRFVNNYIVPITNEIEIKQIDEAVQSPHEVVRIQFHSALEKLSIKPKPDVRNCIKESISAVESAARKALDVKNGTLGDLIPKLRDKFHIHSALAGSLDKLYGWTSDIARHGMKDEDILMIDEARLSLVICSAFANYLLQLQERIDQQS